MKVPFLDLDRLHRSIRPELDAAYERVVSSSEFVGGRLVSEFEEAFAEAHAAPAAAGCGSGTDALALALRALGVGPGDEVVIPAFTFVATAEAVVHVGATPVLADVAGGTLLLDDAAVRSVETERTRAVVPVHLYGHVVPFSDIESWRSRGLLVVEDAAQAHLATWEGRPVGSAGDAACFSFFPGKNLGALGDGGMVVARDPDLINEVRRLRDHGRSTKYQHEEIGFCSRLDGLQAAFLLAKLRHLREWTDARREIADHYRKRLEVVPWDDGAVHHLLVVRIGRSRNGVRDALQRVGIATGVHYPIPLSTQAATAPWHRRCPESERAAEEVVSLPMDPLMTAGEVNHVCAALEEIHS